MSKRVNIPRREDVLLGAPLGRNAFLKKKNNKKESSRLLELVEEEERWGCLGLGTVFVFGGC